MKQYNYFVYIMASKSGTLYTGITNDLGRRIFEHKKDLIEGFSKKYQCHKLVYFEDYNNVIEALEREKQLKGWKRIRKETLIRSINPSWEDLSEDFS